MLPGVSTMWFDEKSPFRFRHDADGLKLALRVALNSNWVVILTPDDMERIPKTWLEDLLRLNEEVTRQYNIAKSNLPPES